MGSDTCSELIVYHVGKTLILPRGILARNPEIAGLVEMVNFGKVHGTVLVQE